MGRFEDERPDFESMSKKQLITLLDGIRAGLVDIEESDAFCLDVGEMLNVNCEYGYYKENGAS